MKEEVLPEALRTFGKEAVYEQKMIEWHQEQAEKALWERIRDVIPEEGDRLRMVTKALRRWVLFDQGKPYLRDQANMDVPEKWIVQAADVEKEELLCWISEMWPEAKSRERNREQIAKEEREAKKAGLG